MGYVTVKKKKFRICRILQLKTSTPIQTDRCLFSKIIKIKNKNRQVLYFKGNYELIKYLSIYNFIDFQAACRL